MRTFLGAVLMLAPLSVLGANWVSATKSSSGDEVFADLESVAQEANGLRKVWLRWDYEKPEYVQSARDSAVGAKELYIANCKQRLAGTRQFLQYNATGKILTSRSQKEVMEDVVPDSVSADVFTKLCKAKL